MFIRCVILRQSGQLTSSQWKAILALQSHKEAIGEALAEPLAVNEDIRLIKEVTGCDMSESDLQDLYWTVRISFFKAGCRSCADFSSNDRINRSTSISTV